MGFNLRLWITAFVAGLFVLSIQRTRSENHNPSYAPPEKHEGKHEVKGHVLDPPAIIHLHTPGGSPCSVVRENIVAMVPYAFGPTPGHVTTLLLPSGTLDVAETIEEIEAQWDQG